MTLESTVAEATRQAQGSRREHVTCGGRDLFDQGTTALTLSRYVSVLDSSLPSTRLIHLA